MRQPDVAGIRAARRLCRRLDAAGISRFHPDPQAALAEAAGRLSSGSRIAISKALIAIPLTILIIGIETASGVRSTRQSRPRLLYEFREFRPGSRARDIVPCGYVARPRTYKNRNSPSHLILLFASCSRTGLNLPVGRHDVALGLGRWTRSEPGRHSAVTAVSHRRADGGCPFLENGGKTE
jgi:hypothetical protein